MYSIERRIELDYGAEKCWDLLTQWENWDAWSESDWFLWRSNIQFRRDPATAQGPGLRVVVSNGGKFLYSMRASEWERPRLLKLYIDDPGRDKRFQMEMTYNFTKETTVSTIVDMKIEFDIDLKRGNWLKEILPVRWTVARKTDQFIERARRAVRAADGPSAF